MPQLVAFLRAINVGGRTVKMDRLREVFAALGYSGVTTFIASGNVIFDAPRKSAERLESEIETALHDALGFAVTTFVRTMSEVADAAAFRPFRIIAPADALYIGFCKSAPGPAAVKAIAALCSDNDEFRVHRRELYWLCRTKISDSPLSGAALEKKLGMPMTMRNSTTVRKIAGTARAAE